MKICQQGMIYRKMVHLPPLIVMTKQNTQYLIRKETRYAHQAQPDDSADPAGSVKAFELRNVQ